MRRFRRYRLSFLVWRVQPSSLTRLLSHYGGSGVG